MQTEQLIPISKACELLGISPWTLRRYPTSLIYPVRYGKKGARRYRMGDIERLQGVVSKQDNLGEETAVYVRVSSQDQKVKGDLDRQKARVLDHTSKNNYKVDFIFEECGSGMNDARPKLKKLFELVNQHKIKRVVIEHRDRLSRFNFLVYQTYFNSHGVEIEIIEQTLPKTFEAELVEDMLSLMSSFSAKIYGKRSHQNKQK